MTQPIPEAGNIHRIGPHWAQIEPPDILHIHYGGDIEIEHHRLFGVLMDTFPPEVRIYILRDARGGGAETAETRAFIAKHVVASRFGGIVTYGSSFHHNTVLMMMNRIMRRSNADTPKALFFDTEVEARAYIEKTRAQWLTPV
jgi:hypothetical protein